MAGPANFGIPAIPDGMTQVDGVMELEGELPVQYRGPRSKEGPELRLVMAVLHDAVKCLRKYRASTSERDKLLFKEARRWFLVDDVQGAYSFEWICDFLDLSANAVRHRLGLTPRLRGGPSVGRFGEKWGKLTDDDLATIGGKRDKLAGLLQQKYGIAKEHVEKQIATFERSLDQTP
jgi:uncharacterized protein YjbJ (UPF0337 family)